VNLSLACACSPSEYERARLTNQIARAHNNDESVVAAAGNSNGTVSSPASEPGMLAVAAGDKAGLLCSFSNRGVGTDVVGPGCDVDLADPTSGELWSEYRSGTSGAAMNVSVAIALLRSYRSDLDWSAAEELVMSSGDRSDAGPLLNVEAIFRRAGLGGLVDKAKERAARTRRTTAPLSESVGESTIVHAAPAGDSLPLPTPLAQPVHGLPTPRISHLNHRRNYVAVAVRNRPARAHLVIDIERRRGEFGYVSLAHFDRRVSRLRLSLRSRVRSVRIVIRYVAGRRTSTALYRSVRI
jgi:hypothetical protein